MKFFASTGYSFFLTAVLAAVCAVSCRKFFSTAPSRTALYYSNSFELPDDAKGWSGLTADMFVVDPAPNSRNRSLQIGGGCIQPTAWLVFPKTKEETRFTLSCWGKVDQPNQSGTVLLRVEGDTGDSNTVSLRIKDRNWMYLTSSAFLVCPKGRQLRVEMLIGGILFASMHVDGLIIEKVAD